MKTLLTLAALVGLWSAMPSGVPPQELEHAFDSAIGSMAGVVSPVSPNPPGPRPDAVKQDLPGDENGENLAVQRSAPAK